MRIFLSYGRSDRERVRKCRRDLDSSGHQTWMDESLVPGADWEKDIEREIANCERALVFLSKKTTRNYKYQQREINLLVEEAKKRPAGFVVPIRLAKCPIPQGLQQAHALDYFERGVWRAWLDHLLPEPKAGPTRLRSIPVGGRALELPVFFPSLSTAAKTTITVPQHIELLLSVSAQQFLVSAADIFKLRKERQKSSRRISELVAQASHNGQIVLLDSGNYERFWQKLPKWTRATFHEVLSYVPVQLAFCYDNLEPPNTVADIVSDIERGVLKDQKAGDLEAMLPIIHCPKPAMFAEVCAQVAVKLHPLMIGVPERELGIGLVERINYIAAIRDALNSTGQYCPLHILGTGNPRSLVLFSLAGADSFDGLEWCQTCVDYETNSLHHLSHMDLYLHQSSMGDVKDIAPAARALTHNLLFYEDFMQRIRVAISAGTIVDFASKVCGAESFNRLLAKSEGLRRSVTMLGIGT